jgi:hypothetical protein
MVNSAQKWVYKAVLTTAPLGIAALFASAAAHADTILISGHDDGDCWGYVQQLGDQQTGVVPPGTTPLNLPPGVSCANYSAQMAPLEGQWISTEDSTNEGAQRAYDICADIQGRRPGAQCTFRAFSEGTLAGAKVQWREVNEGNTRTNLVTDGDAIGSTNLLKAPIVQNPLVGSLACSNPTDNVPVSINPNGIPCMDAPPNTERYYSKYDPFANGNQDNPVALLNDAFNADEHSIQNPNDPHVDFKGPNGELNHVFDVNDPDPVPFAPIDTHIPDSQQPVRSQTPSFPGELQCPGGYYTPGDAPC